MMTLRRAHMCGPLLPDQRREEGAACSVPTIQFESHSTRAEYWSWIEGYKPNCLQEAGMALGHCCIVPQRALIKLIRDNMQIAGLKKVTSIGSGPSLLEFLLSDYCLCVCIDVFYGDTEKNEWLIPPAGALLRQQRSSLAIEEKGMHFIQLDSPRTVAKIDVDSLLLFCWGLCSTKTAREYIQQLSVGGGKAVAVIADRTCSPTTKQVQSWLLDDFNHDCTNPNPSSAWRCVVNQPAATLGSPCTISIFLRTNTRTKKRK